MKLDINFIPFSIATNQQPFMGEAVNDTLIPFFQAVTVDTSVQYGHNITMLYKIYGAGPGVDLPLDMDVYTPTGDTATNMPVDIY